MVKGSTQKEIPHGLIDALKVKLIEMGTDYIKKKLESTKNDILKHLEKTIEKKVKREVRKYSYTLAAYLSLVLGGLFVLYGLIATIVYLLNLPLFITSIIFGFIFIIFGVIVYLLR